MGRDTYSESYTSRQEIVPLDKSTQASAKESPPRELHPKTWTA